MRVPFSEYPGRHERHFRRRLESRLFPRDLDEWTDETLLEVQRLDHEELVDFLDDLRTTVQRAVSLEARAETQVVLDLKADLERLYETAAGLADDQRANQTAIRQLIAVVAQNLRTAVGDDPTAIVELEQEEIARTAHFALLEQPLVADLLHPESVIARDELVPTLLGEDEAALLAALQLFDGPALQALVEDARRLLAAKDWTANAPAAARARRNLDLIERRLRAPRSALGVS
jgi:hypothetical protein